MSKFPCEAVAGNNTASGCSDAVSAVADKQSGCPDETVAGKNTASGCPDAMFARLAPNLDVQIACREV